MKILGLNFSNDAAAALVIDGRVEAAVQEERFTRIKHDRGFPFQSVQYCLGHAGMQLSDLDAVAFFWNPLHHMDTYSARMNSAFRHHLEYLYDVPASLARYLPTAWTRAPYVKLCIPLPDGRELPFYFVEHHLAHAASAFLGTPWPEAAILTVDGYGERTSTLLARGRGTSLEVLGRVDFPHSIGSVYAAVTEFLGFKPNRDEGKVMGLASYGKPTYLQEFRELVRLTDDGYQVDLNAFRYYMEAPSRVSEVFVQRFGAPRAADGPLTDRDRDLAASLQVRTEEVLVHLARRLKALTGLPALAMAGGVTLNCVANGRVMREAGFEHCFFLPASSDAGASLGAALYVEHVLGGNPARLPFPGEYLGPGYTDAQIEARLARGGVPVTRVDGIEHRVAALLAEGKIVGWFQGRAEFGPRALGNRSILADPRRADMKDVLNARVKFREPFRPFAPSILEEACGQFFSSAVPSPYMLRVYDTLPDKLAVLPSITHVDGGARVQTVNRAQNAKYYDLIHAFGELTGVPCVLNTSFNIRGEPIVTTPEEAYRCFASTDMDALAMGSFLFQK
jgi:carbamoyltransferase